jgi:hypothetical protein
VNKVMDDTGVVGLVTFCKRWAVSCGVIVGLFGISLAAVPTLAGGVTRSGHAEAVKACAAPAPGYAGCFALVRKAVAAPPAGATRGKARPFVLGGGSATAGPAGGLTPEDLASAYAFSPTSGGSAQTVGIVDAFDDPSIEGDLATFSSEYGLPACTAANGCLSKVGQSGGGLPAADTTGWSIETALDVETVHATCPKCKILLVEANSNSYANLAAAVNRAVALGATVVSNSYGGAELGFTERAAYNHPGVPIVASTGDDGYYDWDFVNIGFFGEEMPNAPAVLPTVVAVGGTTLDLNPDGTRADETVWNWSGPGDVFEELGASGGGCSFLFEAEPWQRDVSGFAASGCGSKRLDADVSAVADPDTGLDIYDTYDCGAGCGGLDEGWETIGGTSLSAPFISALYALAGGGHGLSYPSLTLYGQAADTDSRFDVVAGGNGFCGGESVAACGHPNPVLGLVDCEGTSACDAVPGFDGPSGVGAPKGLGLFEPQLPTAVLSAPNSLTAGDPATFSAVGSSPHYPGDSIAGASWTWGDGTTGTGTTASHVYAAAGTYTVTLAVSDEDGLKSASVTRSIEVGAASVVGEDESEEGAGTGGGGVAPPGEGGGIASGGAGTSSGTGTATSSAIGTGGSGGTAGFQVGVSTQSPSARLAGSSLTASAAGAVALKIVCAAAGGNCTGTVTLRTLTAVSAARAGERKKKAILTLGSAAFSVVAGKTGTVTLHLSVKARSLLARARVLRALASIAVHGSSGTAHPATATVTVRPAIKRRASR